MFELCVFRSKQIASLPCSVIISSSFPTRITLHIKNTKMPETIVCHCCVTVWMRCSFYYTDSGRCAGRYNPDAPLHLGAVCQKLLLEQGLDFLGTPEAQSSEVKRKIHPIPFWRVLFHRIFMGSFHTFQTLTYCLNGAMVCWNQPLLF